MSYADKTMQRQANPYPVPSHRFFVRMFLLGGAVGLALLLMGAPLWLFYVAPLVMTPFLVRELRSLAAENRAQPGSRRALL
ncbi:MAG TPA: hypothetical protein VFY48_04835 [Solirubrobacterales bacterium]|nr:hypothetical protein [Solirubrobacterales bacterium]